MQDGSSDQYWLALGSMTRTARLTLGSTLQDVARSAGCDISRISRFERQGAALRPATLQGVFHAVYAGLAQQGSVPTFLSHCKHLGIYIHHTTQLDQPLLQFPFGDQGSGPGMLDDWCAWLAVGRGHGQHLDHQRAIEAFTLGIHSARRTNTPSAAALLLAELASSWRDLNDLERAWALTTEALGLLNCQDCTPEQGLSQDVVEEIGRRDGHIGLAALGRLATVRGHALLDQEQLGKARTTFTSLETIGEVLADPQLVATALHFRGRVLLEFGTHIEEEGLSWRSVRSASSLNRAVAYFNQARDRRPSGDWQGRGHDWRQEAKAFRLLGDEQLAERAEVEAQALLGSSLAYANLCIDRGRFALSAEDDHQAANLLHQGLYLAWELRSPTLVWSSLSGLADLTASTADMIAGTRHSYDQAFAYASAALVAWPISPGKGELRRFRRTARLFRALAELTGQQRVELAQVVDTARYPYDLLTQLPNFSMHQVQGVSSRVDALLAR